MFEDGQEIILLTGESTPSSDWNSTLQLCIQKLVAVPAISLVWKTCDALVNVVKYGQHYMVQCLLADGKPRKQNATRRYSFTNGFIVTFNHLLGC